MKLWTLETGNTETAYKSKAYLEVVKDKDQRGYNQLQRFKTYG